MDYSATLDYLFHQFTSFKKYGASAVKYGLHNIEALCETLDNPHQKFNSIHIAGTNGKGSVTHILTSIFMAAGYKSGTFSSPHYIDFRERIKINGEYIGKEEVVKFVKDNRTLFEQTSASFFEITAAMAFWYFEKQKVDIAIIETGLGGRLDSTNVITPQLSVITNIGYDHQKTLGNTLPEIAAEKAGIIKQNIPVIIGEEQEEVKQIFIEKSKSLSAPIAYANEVVSLKKIQNNIETCKSAYQASYQKTNEQFEFETDLTASYQKKNLTTALAAAEVYSLHQKEKISTPSILQKAVNNIKTTTKMLGKWMLLQQNPIVIADSAHNREGIIAALEALKNRSYNQLHIVLGIMKDKDVDHYLKLLPNKAIYYFCNATFRRAMNSKELMLKAKNFNLFGNNFTTVKAAKFEAINKAQNDDLVLITGSCFVVAEAL